MKMTKAERLEIEASARGAVNKLFNANASNQTVSYQTYKGAKFSYPITIYHYDKASQALKEIGMF